jgi:hypothetical protein
VGRCAPHHGEALQRAYAGRVHQLEGEIESLKARLEGQGQKASRAHAWPCYHFMDTHPGARVPPMLTGARSTTTDDFVEWLQYPDVMSGRTRLSLLQEAYDTNDAPRFAAIFESFLREAGRLRPLRRLRPTEAVKPLTSLPQSGNGLERFAAPGPARSAPVATGTPAAQEFFTTGDITRFYTDKGLASGRGARRRADLRAAIFAAGNSNRVRPGNPSP